MKQFSRITTLLLAVVLIFPVIAVSAQEKHDAPASNDKSKRPSPPAQATLKLNGSTVATIDYSTPSMRGRKIFGELVPFDQVWRTGANEATTLVTKVDLKIGGTTVPAGNYTLFTLPSANGWKLIISKDTGEWGTDYKQDKDLARVDMQVEKTKAPVEKFKISFEGGKLVMEWENTRASVPVSKA